MDQDREHTRKRRKTVKHPDRVSFRHAQRNEPVRRVIAPTLRSGTAGELAQHRDESRVEDRNEENEDRHREHRQKTTRSPATHIHEGRTGEKESDKHRTAVAHEDRRGIRVVNEKTDQRTCEQQHDQRFVNLPGVDKTEAQKPRRDHGDARREPVHVVEQVDCVRDADQPEDGERHVQQNRAGPRQRQTVVNDESRAENLSDKFLVRLDVNHIVNESDEKQERAREQDVSSVDRRRNENEIANDDCEPDGSAAEHGGWFLVPAIGFRNSNHADAPGKRAHERCEYCG